MSNEIEHIEYDRDINPYPCSGKIYNSEPAIISLTSWKARINTVSKTLFSLIKQCPGFHIVLVLSEEEFPQKEKELPENLMVFVENELIELLWVYKNYKSFKKVLFTMDKYRTVPVISADDGCIYIRNYAEELYQKWLYDKNKIIAFNVHKSEYTGGGGGNGICYPPFCFYSCGTDILKQYQKILIKNPNDDRFIGCLSTFLKIKWKEMPYKIINYINLNAAELNGMGRNKLFLPGTNWKFIDLLKSYLKSYVSDK